jgi:predicted metal-dependent peptidase
MMDPKNTFYTSILYNLHIYWVDENSSDKYKPIRTAATDNYTIYWNVKCFLECSPQERIGITLHEILHIALNHILRGRGLGLDAEDWNIAGDYVINGFLRKAGYTLPSWVLYDSKYDDDMVWDTDAVYKDVQKAGAAKKAFWKDFWNKYGPDLLDPPDGIPAGKLDEHVRDLVTQGNEIGGGGCGNMPGELERFIQELLDPKLPWFVIFQNYMLNYAKDDFSWKRPSRRYMPDYYLPSAHSDHMVDFDIYPDLSGSIGDKEKNFFASEIRSMQLNIEPENITLMTWDTQVYEPQVITRNTNLIKDIKFHGGGGTSIVPVFEMIKSRTATVCVIFTDGCFSMPRDEAAFPRNTDIIWVIDGDPNWTAPIGKVIHFNIYDYDEAA